MLKENNSEELSSSEPITQDAGIEAILGMINPKDLGEIEDEPVSEAELEEESEEEAEENPEEDEGEYELEEGDDAEEEDFSGDIELGADEYEHIVAAREFLTEQGLDNIEKIKSGILMQGDYTRKTQELSEARKTFETDSVAKLEQIAQSLEIAQAMVLGSKPEYTTNELLALKQTDPHAYDEALEATVMFQKKQAEIDAVSKEVGEQYQGMQDKQKAEYAQQQSQVLIQMEPSFGDETTAKENIAVIAEYFEGVGGSMSMLNGVNDAIVLKVLLDAARANSTQKQVAKVKAPPKKKVAKTVLRKGASTSRAQKKAAASTKKLKDATSSDGTFSREAATALILDSFK